jgi:hypothetical protein
MEQLESAAALSANDNQIACADAHSLAASLGLTPDQFGAAVTKTTAFRFYRCQLGLFGYGPKAEGLSKIVLAARHVPAEIGAEIESVARGGSLSCADVWAIAAKYAYPRLGVANIVEAMGLRIRPCQLGCF